MRWFALDMRPMALFREMECLAEVSYCTGMKTTLMQRIGRLFARSRKVETALPMMETIEGRLLMSVTPTLTATTEPQTISLLLPAVQKVREAAARMTDGTSNTLMIGE